MDFSKVGVVRLSNKNYRSWAFKVQMLMMREGTWKYVDPGVAPAPVTPDWTEGDMKARATIALLTEDSQHNLIMTKATAKETWDALKAHHHKATLTGKVALLKEICSANYREGESMEVFLYEMEDLYSRLENAGERLSANMQVAMVLRSLPKSFDALTTALESRSDKELTMDLVRAKLIDESEKLYGEKVQEERVLKAKGDAKPICFFCGQSGHKKRDCKKFLSRKNSRDSEDKIETRNKPKKDERVKKVRENDARSFTFMVRQSDTRGASCSWLLDSGATSHMCSDINGFTVIEKSSRSKVTVADGSENHVEGVGDCLIRCATENGQSIELTLRGVLYVPTLEGNMISIGKLAEKGVRAVFDNTGCKLVYENTVVAIADKASDMYWLRVAQEQVMKSVVKQHTKNCQHTWHRRLGHRDPAVLGEMKRRDLVSGLNVVDCGIRWTCECCIECKMARPPFPSVAEKTSTAVLDIIHSDVCGPMEVTTPGGCRYYMTLIDDYSRYTFVYFLKHKSEVENKIREFVKLVQNQFGRKPRIIRSDQGGEYSSKELRKFYTNEGIKVEYTTAYSPQQNGVSERKNRSLSEMGRCMLRDAGMHKKYWAEAINTACYLQNRLPSAAVGSTPFEMWFGRKPELKHLRLFGCSGYMMIPAAKRSKLDVKALKMTFVGYSAEHKAYRMLDMSTGQIHISRDVRFIELGDGSKETLPEQKLGESSEIEWTFTEKKSQDEECDANSESDFFDCDEDGGLTRLPRVDNEGDPTSNSGTEIRRSHRKTAGVPPARYAGRVNLAAQIVDEPRTYTEAISGPQSTEWKSAIAEEMQSHRDNGIMGNLRFFLGIRIRLDDGRYCIDQQAYLERVLERFGMRDAKPSKYPMDPGFLKRKEEIDTRLDSPIAYQSLIGALLYAAVTSRPDISIATAILGRRVQHPSETDWNEAKRVLRYLKGTLNHVLYLGGSDQKLECFVDADWAGDESDRKSNSGFVFKFGGGLIGWGCHKQKCVALSSTEAEYVSLAECLQEVKWILKLMADVGEQLVGPVLVHEDNQSCIALTKGDRAERKAKHIDTKFNFVKDMVRDGIVQLQYCATEQMQADLLTKPLQAVKLRQHREAIGIKPFSVEEEC